MLPSGEHLTPEEVARLTRKSVMAVQAALRRGDLRGYKVGRDWRVTPEALEDYCREWRPAAPPARRRASGSKLAADHAARLRRMEERLRATGMLS